MTLGERWNNVHPMSYAGKYHVASCLKIGRMSADKHVLAWINVGSMSFDVEPTLFNDIQLLVTGFCKIESVR